MVIMTMTMTMLLLMLLLLLLLLLMHTWFLRKSASLRGVSMVATPSVTSWLPMTYSAVQRESIK
jgi:hypothetical protein